MMKLALNIALALLATTSLSASYANDVSKLKDVTFSKINPVDSSLWIATSDRGLIRLGRNRKVFSYSSAKGDFPCDSIVALDFDSAGTLWFLDSKGNTYSYTSLQGFVRSEPAAEIAEALSLYTKEEPAGASVPAVEETNARPSGVRWWQILLVLAGFALFFLLGRGSLEKATNGSVAKADEQAEQPAEPQAETPAETSAETPAKEEIPAAPQIPAAIPQQAVSTVQKSDVTKSNVSEAELQSFCNEVVKFINDNYSDPSFSVESVASHFGISRVHLNRKLKAASMPSPSELIKSTRMKLAARLLQSGKISVVEVARQCGFSSAAYFSAAFKEYYDKSPSSFLPTSEGSES